MTRSSPIRMLPALTLLLLTACAGWRGAYGPELEGSGIESTGAATVVRSQQLHESQVSVLRTLMGKVPNLKVEFYTYGRCPSIAMRRSQEVQGYNYPDVYVDGTRTHGTCVLETLPAREFDRVEIYPAGFTSRPGYSTSTHGLILLFSRKQ